MKRASRCGAPSTATWRTTVGMNRASGSAAAWVSLGSSPCVTTLPGWMASLRATLSDVLALVRHHLWGNFPYTTSPADPDVVFLPRSTLVQLTHAVC